MEFVHEDRHASAVDEIGRHVLKTQMDENEFPLDIAADYDAYLVKKPPERQKEKRNIARQQSSTGPTMGSSTSKRIYNAYSDMQKEQFSFLYHEKQLTAGKPVTKLGISRSTAYSWLKKGKEEPSDEVQPRKVPEKRGGRTRPLDDTHRQHLNASIDDNPSIALEQMLMSLTEQFDGLTLSGPTLHRFVHDQYSITFKKEIVPRKYKRDTTRQLKCEKPIWMLQASTSLLMSLLSMAISSDREPGQAKGSRVKVIVPQTRAKTTTVLGALSAFDVTNVKRRPQQSKKCKAVGSMTTKWTYSDGYPKGDRESRL